uniref:(northern house mosquito) hypothetical protein n=1 Tax=Culex pipiens TaxID=7175 RepID=A0A8D8MB82_CULPI
MPGHPARAHPEAAERGHGPPTGDRGADHRPGSVRRQVRAARVAHRQELPQDEADDPHAAERSDQDEEDCGDPPQRAAAAAVLRKRRRCTFSKAEIRVKHVDCLDYFNVST